MNKKLTAKTQKITPRIPDIASSFATVTIQIPEKEDYIQKKGSIYAVFEVRSGKEVETLPITKLVIDTLQNAYFGSENISPIQSLEKAVSDVKVNLEKLGGSDGIELNIATAVLWGNVLYIVTYGNSKSFIMRQGEIKPVTFISEGNFSAASGIIKDDDVVIFGTSSFIDMYPPEKLLRVSGEEFETLETNAACLMLKFNLETALTEKEDIDFEIKGRKDIKSSIKKQLGKIKGKKPRQREKITGIGGGNKPKLDVLKKALIPGVAVLLAGSIFYTIKAKSGSKVVSPIKLERKTDENIGNEDKTENIEDKNETTETPTNIFYDLKIKDSQINPTEIEVVGDKIVVLDKATNSLLTAEISSPTFIKLENSYEGIENLESFDGLLAFIDNEGVKLLDIEKSSVEENYSNEDKLEVATLYLDYIYEISDGSINKYSKSGSSLEKSVWATSADFESAEDLAIDVSIYVITSEGEVVSYTQGTKDDFLIGEMDKELIDPTQITTNPNLDNIYIADRGTQSIVVIDKEGDFVKRVEHEVEGSLNDIKSFAVSEDESKVFVLNDTYIFEFDL